jgi:hypothetical protein
MILRPLGRKIGRTAPSPTGSWDSFDCREVASGPVSASPAVRLGLTQKRDRAQGRDASAAGSSMAPARSLR